MENGVRIVAINGAPASGKTTFGKFIKEELGAYCKSRSSIDRVKEIAEICGWDHVKDGTSRKFLSDLKDLLTNYNDLPMADIKKVYKNWVDELSYYGVQSRNAVLLADIREPQELQRAKDELGAVTVVVRNTKAEETETTNHADQEVLNFNYDYIIYNNGSLDDLKQRAHDFLVWLFENY